MLLRCHAITLRDVLNFRRVWLTLVTRMIVLATMFQEDCILTSIKLEPHELQATFASIYFCGAHLEFILSTRRVDD